MVGNVAIYGIDSVPKSKIPIFDYSEFEAPDSTPLTSSTPSTLSTPSSPAENCWKLLVMHQIMSPFPYAEWDCDEVLENLPFRVDAVLLGDYHEHAITKNKTGETWITYPGSTERNSTSEKEARSYNIITLSEKGVEISKRTITTRRFLFIPPVELTGEDKPYEQIFSKVNEYLEEIPESVVFLEIFGDSGIVLSQSELEEYLLNKGALVSNIKDRRLKESLPEEALNVTFSDPDHAVANEIKRMNLNDGGLIIDEIVRSPNISRSRVDQETENRLSKLIQAKTTDFKSPDFEIEVAPRPSNPTYPASSATITGIPELEKVKSDGEVCHAENIKPATEPEFAGKTGLAGKNMPAGIIAGKLEITELSGILRTSEGIENTEKKSTEKGTEASKSIEISAANLDSSGLAPGSNSEQPSNMESLELLDSGSTEMSDEPIAPQELYFPQKTSWTSEKTPITGIEFLKDRDNELEIKLESKAEIKSEIKPESKFPENKPEKEIQKL
ncbi:MAG TPA: DNA double-strand break repair protein Mre11, partial [Methanosarcina sp.]|nr:DNA double-strand break repair protein Mre11 [Methanosarcina sp.]